MEYRPDFGTVALLVGLLAICGLIWQAMRGPGPKDYHPAVKASLAWSVAYSAFGAVGGLVLAVVGAVRSAWGLAALGLLIAVLGAAIATLQYLAYFKRRSGRR